MPTRGTFASWGGRGRWPSAVAWLPAMVWLPAALWLPVVGASLAWNWHGASDDALRVAESEARAAYEKDLIYRRWASLQGGVYVKPSAMTPPNPYLAHLPDRDVVTSTGQALTLVNPAYMTRQVHELGAQQYEARGHITSLNPLNPANRPDAWEAGVLRSFEGGAAGATTLMEIEGRTYFRLMRPFVTEASCLRCHAAQGYRVGDIRGGVSVSLPFDRYQASARAQQMPLLWAHLLIGVVGLAGIAGSARMLRRSDRVLRARAARHAAVLETAIDGFWIVDAGGRLLEVNDAYCRMSGYAADELLGMRVADLEVHESDADTAAHIGRVREAGSDRFESRHRRKDGSEFDVEVSVQFAPAAEHHGEYFVAFVRDITDRRRAAAERARLEARLGQAQRIESVGRLAGGVAHDFNNMVGVIRGYTELALRRVPASDPLHADLVEVHAAALRSADLTRQLLGFARQQTVTPRVLDLNDAVESTLKMLRRLIGENIDLVWEAGAGLWPVRVDPAQVDQVLANLCVNARDAIAGVGTVTIETANAVLDDAFCATRPGAVPGDYVRLVVRDTGPGIPPSALPHIFEPFFTTKPVGEGTGLGLATVYGIVKQNAGFIDAESEPGRGAVFTVYLPRHRGAAAGSARDGGALQAAGLPTGTETVLLVEDEAAMLKMTAGALRQLGYTVLAASTPETGLELAAGHEGPLHLLLTDVVMPRMNGRDLAAQVRAIRPGLPCVFMSGYTAGIIGPGSVLDEGVHFLQKPFTLAELAGTLRRVLEAPPPAAPPPAAPPPA